MDTAGDAEDATNSQTVHGSADDQEASDVAKRGRCRGQGTYDDSWLRFNTVLICLPPRKSVYSF